MIGGNGEVLKAKCVECGKKKEIVRGKDVCWQCHLGGVSIHARIEARKSGGSSSAAEGEQFKYLG